MTGNLSCDHYTARWVDPVFEEVDASISDYEKTRTFTKLGSAVAWCRKQVLAGRCFADQIELEIITPMGFRSTYEIEVRGVRGWSTTTFGGVKTTLGPLENSIEPHTRKRRGRLR